MTDLLKLTSVSRNFGGLSVLQDVSLTVPKGGIFGLIGPNGAGKTTLFNLMTGLLPPSAGSITFEGNTILGLRPHEITRCGLSRTFQNIRLFREMSLVENVMVGMHSRLNYGLMAMLFGGPSFRAKERAARDRARELLMWVGLEDKSQQDAGNLSYGDQRKLELARALAADPKMLLLDEPVAGMNSVEKQELMREIERIAARGYTVLLIEHDMRFVMGLCQQIAVLNFGRIIKQGTAEQVKTDPQVIEAYLGRDEDVATEEFA